MSTRATGIKARRRALLRWYDAEGRDLPWRRTKDPYAVWVSEVMLQQTQVGTVIPYWTRFVDRFPNAAALAAADEDEVLAAWSGLGYYRRARLLHAGVRDVVERYGGQVPEDRAARLALPGVGRYTAGAIGSIAFDRQEPVVDGNVSRVLARLHGIDTPLGRRETETALWEHADALVKGERPGDLNQALMELGARVCTPRAPRCERCPLLRACSARQTDRVDQLPVKKPKNAIKRMRIAAVVALRGGDHVALVKQGGTLFGGLFGTPTARGHGRAAARSALADAAVRARLERRPVGALEHVLSHRHLEVQVWRSVGASLGNLEASQVSSREASQVSSREASQERRLLPVDGLHDVGTSTMTRRIIAMATGR